MAVPSNVNERVKSEIFVLVESVGVGIDAV